jgi:hypothetical protein
MGNCHGEHMGVVGYYKPAKRAVFFHFVIGKSLNSLHREPYLIMNDVTTDKPLLHYIIDGALKFLLTIRSIDEKGR